MKKFLLLLLLVCASAYAGGCSSAVYFRSNPQGAKLTINGMPSGTTPCSVQLNWNTFTTFDIKLEKEGYRPYMTRLEGEVKVLYLIVDILFWPMAFFNAYGPKPDYSFNMVPLGDAAGAQPVAQPPPSSEEGPPVGSQAQPGSVVVYGNVEKRPRMACLEFRKGNEQAGQYITTVQEMFCTGFVESRRFTVVEREQIEKILKEKQFAQTGVVDARTARELGSVLGVSFLLIGSVSKLGETYEIDARLVDVATGETETASHGSCSSESGLRSAIGGIVNDLNRKFSGQ